jgi:hypothetical protein
MTALSITDALLAESKGSVGGAAETEPTPSNDTASSREGLWEPHVVVYERIHWCLELPVNIPYGSRFLRAKKSFMISVWREEGFFCADDTVGLGVSEAAPTYSELTTSIYEALTFLWDEYALAEDSELSAGAIVLKRVMLERFAAVE